MPTRETHELLTAKLRAATGMRHDQARRAAQIALAMGAGTEGASTPVAQEPWRAVSVSGTAVADEADWLEAVFGAGGADYAAAAAEEARTAAASSGRNMPGASPPPQSGSSRAWKEPESLRAEVGLRLERGRGWAARWSAFRNVFAATGTTTTTSWTPLTARIVPALGSGALLWEDLGVESSDGVAARRRAARAAQLAYHPDRFGRAFRTALLRSGRHEAGLIRAKVLAIVQAVNTLAATLDE